jgi:O-antigen/teichoic acid export membrane protein
MQQAYENILNSDTTSSPIELAEQEAILEEQPVEQGTARTALESTAMRATFWIVVDYGGAMALRVGNSVILTHLLMPEYFGLMTIVSTLVSGISLLSDIGLSSSVIQSSRGDDVNFLNTAWTIQILRGLGIFMISLLMAWPMSLIYHDSRLIGLMAALGLNIIIMSFNSTNMLTMARHMGVRRLFLLDITTQLFSLIVTASLAWFYKSVWALVIGTILSTVYKLVLSHSQWMLPGIRNRLHWDKDSVHDLVHFGKWILLATALFFFASQSDRLIMGKLISFALLGVYGVAYSVSDIPRQVINAFSTRVGFPFIAKLLHLPKDEFRRTFLRYRFLTLLAGAALLVLVVHLGGWLVARVYDSRYHAASWMVPVLAIGLWHTLMYATTNPVLLSLGKSKYGAIGGGAYFVAIILAIPIGFHLYGMFGAVVGVAAGDLPLYVVLAAGASREGVSTWRQDIQATAVFLALLGAGFAIRAAIGLPLWFR